MGGWWSEGQEDVSKVVFQPALTHSKASQTTPTMESNRRCVVFALFGTYALAANSAAADKTGCCLTIASGMASIETREGVLESNCNTGQSGGKKTIFIPSACPQGATQQGSPSQSNPPKYGDYAQQYGVEKPTPAPSSYSPAVAPGYGDEPAGGIQVAQALDPVFDGTYTLMQRSFADNPAWRNQNGKGYIYTCERPDYSLHW